MPRGEQRARQDRVLALTGEIMDELGWFSDVDRDRALKLARRINIAVATESLPPCKTCTGRTVVYANPDEAEPSQLCPDCEDGTDPLTTEAIAAALAKATPGPWRETWESCDCGDGYGCHHGSWLYAIHLPDVPTYTLPDESQALPGYWHTRCEHTELATMPVDTARFMARSREYVETLLHRLDAAAADAPQRVTVTLPDDPRVHSLLAGLLNQAYLAGVTGSDAGIAERADAAVRGLAALNRRMAATKEES